MRAIRLLFSILSIACGGMLLSPAFAANAQSAEAVTRSFYSWYVPKAIAARDQPAWAKVLRRRPAILSARLQHELQADLKKKAHASGMIEGIDFDPFLGGQDPCPSFAIGKTRTERARYLVEVRPVCPSAAAQPTVTVYLIRNRSGFVIDDVAYVGGNTLRHILAAQ
jgi:hypothetical protein